MMYRYTVVTFYSCFFTSLLNITVGVNQLQEGTYVELLDGHLNQPGHRKVVLKYFSITAMHTQTLPLFLDTL